jgi:spermidine/putrescine-binding protein
MKTTIILTTLALAMTTSARCFTDSATWDNREQAHTFINDACYKSGGMFTGNHAPHQPKAMCPRGQDQNIDFVVQNLNANTGFDLANQDCYDKLDSEISKCAHGGETTNTGWFFR